VNDDMGSMWNKVVLAYFKVPSQHKPEETEENHDRMISFRLNSDQEPPEYKGLLTTKL
jgi:hypothetical protein